MKPPVGTPVRDTRNDRTGRVMGYEGPYVQLRPLAGGREWDVPPDNIEEVTLSEALSGAVAGENARSRRRV